MQVTFYKEGNFGVGCNNNFGVIILDIFYIDCFLLLFMRFCVNKIL